MKAKRIVSILLTGSMLLSLLPVSALAAAPVFDAPAQTTAKKAAPLVQEADASRSTEEEAATRSSRDLDAENSTSDSFTIDLNAGGMPESEGDYDHWFYSANSTTLFLYDGTFTLQPSSDPEAASALQADLDIREGVEFNGGTVGDYTYNNGTISGGIFQREVFNYGIISDGTFQGEVYNNDGTISGGTFQGESYNFRGTISNGTFQGILHNDSGTISGGTFKEAVEVNAASGTEATIEGGTFEKRVTLKRSDTPITISNGLFNGEVVAEECYAPLSISGGLFTNAVDVSSTDPSKLSITGGYFVNEPTLPEGSGIAFTSVSDQSGRTFHVPVNGDWSEKRYSSLYVPRGSSEQPNTITVKTNTKLLYYLADGERFPILDSDSDSYIYQIPVRGYEKIVLVTEEPSAPPTDDPGELDPAFSSGAAALGIVLGTAGLGYVAYINGTSLYLHYALPDGFIPSTRQELANVLWTTAGKPDPVSTALYTDIPADNIEQQKAARWCVEQGLLSDHGATFGPDTTVTNARIIRAWNSLKKVPVPITN
ncbi:hypothetical protein [Faecalibacterium prausnitzii]|uniref:hypothetical protein n=1 Tax=Faecalibacterium prausnitzii TaxID=853 RepID=UPI00101FF5A9|nr:hypothetical protein [Faecalibacterium prausnitzii]MSC66609.1 hypothetical protein [Faecalibacterium prausnitzii]MSC72159.1 hypothetical protein [Faecalibacterium prausnitzii]MSC97865.1 hypothetical protein [Faecalibacterium prausnitzii]MSD38775.1 hypothetical protein [Faecalibacterium prausnitzii]MSD51983.1 hypothetical protein [Faecalibacterium prausnitzii]